MCFTNVNEAGIRYQYFMYSTNKCTDFNKNITLKKKKTQKNLGVAPWRRKFSRLNVLFICYGTAVEHRSLLNRSAGVKKSTSPTPGASDFHIWASWNNQLYARLASKKIYRILTNLSIFAYLLIFIYVICCLISSNVLFIQLLAFCRNWEQRR
jgi:hypothetical protein